jgi:hypothetical protein
LITLLAVLGLMGAGTSGVIAASGGNSGGGSAAKSQYKEKNECKNVAKSDKKACKGDEKMEKKDCKAQGLKGDAYRQCEDQNDAADNFNAALAQANAG